MSRSGNEPPSATLRTARTRSRRSADGHGEPFVLQVGQQRPVLPLRPSSARADRSKGQLGLFYGQLVDQELPGTRRTNA
jgi:hypothetical protein